MLADICSTAISEDSDALFKNLGHLGFLFLFQLYSRNGGDAESDHDHNISPRSSFSMSRLIFYCHGKLTKYLHLFVT
jgi:hypothetical protein